MAGSVLDVGLPDLAPSPSYSAPPCLPRAQDHLADPWNANGFAYASKWVPGLN